MALIKKKTALLLLQYAIFFGLSFALIYWQYTKLTDKNISELGEALIQVKERSWIIIPIIIIGFLSHFFRAMRWRIMLESLNIKPSVVNITAAVFIGYLTNLLIPRMGEVAKCTVLARYESEPADKLIGTIVAERAFDMICLLLISVLTFLVQADIIGNYLSDLKSNMGNKNLPLMLSIGIGALVLIVVLLIWVYRRNKNSKVGGFIKGMGEGLTVILTMKKRAQFLGYTFLIWFGYLSLIYIGFWALPATEKLSWAAALSILVFGSIGMIATPGGLGAYPPIVKAVLSMLYAVKDSFGLAFGWIAWLVQTLIIIVFGLLSLLILPIYNNSKKNGQTSVDTK